MDFNLVSAALGTVVGVIGATLYWVLKYNDVVFNLGLMRDDLYVAQAELENALRPPPVKKTTVPRVRKGTARL